jgi:hypothetical protein
MKPVIRIAVFAAMAIASIAMASAPQRHETRPVSGFHAVSLAAPINVEIVQGDTESLTLDADEELLAVLETVVENGVLKIRDTSTWGRTWHIDHVIARITMKTIDSLSTRGSGDIKAAAVKSDGLKVAIAGSGDIFIGALTANELDVSIAGSGDMMVGGKVDHVHTSIAGSGDMKAGRLDSRTSNVSIAGSGDATLWARESISASIVGSGDVRYFGDPAVKSSVMGSGSVKRMGASPT